MIISITISGFKRFMHERFVMAPLTVLTGLNGSGKTSLLQSVLLATEASSRKSASLRLNGPFSLELGTAEDVLNWDSSSPIEISVAASGTETGAWRFAVPSEDALYLDIMSRPEEPPKSLSGEPRALTYLSAERLALLWQILIDGPGEEHLTVRAPWRGRSGEEIENGLPDGRHARLWRRAPDSFFSVPLP